MSAAEHESLVYSVKILDEMEELYKEAQETDFNFCESVEGFNNLYQDMEIFEQYMQLYDELEETIQEEYNGLKRAKVFKALKEFQFEKARQKLTEEKQKGGQVA